MVKCSDLPISTFMLPFRFIYWVTPIFLCNDFENTTFECDFSEALVNNCFWFSSCSRQLESLSDSLTLSWVFHVPWIGYSGICFIKSWDCYIFTGLRVSWVVLRRKADLLKLFFSLLDIDLDSVSVLKTSIKIFYTYASVHLVSKTSSSGQILCNFGIFSNFPDVKTFFRA